MHNEIFVLYNRLAMRYTDVFTSPNRVTAAMRLRDSGLNGDEFELCHLGSIDVATGSVRLLDGLVRCPLLGKDDNPVDFLDNME